MPKTIFSERRLVCMNLANLEKLGFSGGCHWCTEAVFQAVVGVEKVEQGWISPAGIAGTFYEGVLVHFDPALVDIDLLVAIHLHSHSATADHSMRNKYRSGVYVFSQLQGDQLMRAMVKEQRALGKKVVTEILRLGEFKLNAPEFLNYYATDPDRPFCKTYIQPKLQALVLRFGERIKFAAREIK